jgi:Flp pilus assembly protein TadD
MTKTQKIFFSAVGLVLLAAAVAGTYQYRLEQQRQNEAALALIETGIAQFKQNQYASAVETLRSIPEGVIEDWRAPYYIGTALIQLRDFEGAVVSLEEALSLNDKEEGIPFALGVAYFKLGKLGLSKSYFHTVLEINPNNADAKGLMDIMANLERQQPAAPTPDENMENTNH